MHEFLKLNEDQRRIIFEQTAIKSGRDIREIEKDYWMSMALRCLSRLDCSDCLALGGDYALFKVWGLMRRMPETIDASLNFWRPAEPFPNELWSRLRRCLLCRHILLPDLKKEISALGIPGFSVKAARNFPLSGYSVFKFAFPGVVEDRKAGKKEFSLRIGMYSGPEHPVLTDVSSVAAAAYPQVLPDETGIHVLAAESDQLYIEKVLSLSDAVSVSPRSADVSAIALIMSELHEMQGRAAALKGNVNPMLLVKAAAAKKRIDPSKTEQFALKFRENFRLIPPKEIWPSLEREYAALSQRQRPCVSQATPGPNEPQTSPDSEASSGCSTSQAPFNDILLELLGLEEAFKSFPLGSFSPRRSLRKRNYHTRQQR